MLYQYRDFQSATKLGVFCANLDVACDLIPGVSTVTNISRIAVKILFASSWLCLSVMTGAGYAFKATMIALFVKKDKKFQVALCFYKFIHTSFSIQSLWIKTFFSHHYMKKSYVESFLHALPLIGNLMAYKMTESRSYSSCVKVWETKMKQWEIKPSAAQNTPLFSCYYPSLVPSHLKESKALIIADCKLNPYHITKISKENFADIDFCKELMRVLTYYHHGRCSYINKTDFNELLSFVIKQAQAFNLMEEIVLPLEGYLFNHDFGEFLDLVRKYPDILWLIEDNEFFQHKKYVSLVIQSCPHIISIMSDHFLKLNKTLVIQALTQDSFIASKLSLSILLFSFSSKENVLSDGVFLACDKFHPGLKKAMIDHLNKKKLVKRLKFT